MASADSRDGGYADFQASGDSWSLCQAVFAGKGRSQYTTICDDGGRRHYYHFRSDWSVPTMPDDDYTVKSNFPQQKVTSYVKLFDEDNSILVFDTNLTRRGQDGKLVTIDEFKPDNVHFTMLAILKKHGLVELTEPGSKFMVDLVNEVNTLLGEVKDASSASKVEAEPKMFAKSATDSARDDYTREHTADLVAALLTEDEKELTIDEMLELLKKEKHDEDERRKKAAIMADIASSRQRKLDEEAAIADAKAKEEAAKAAIMADIAAIRQRKQQYSVSTGYATVAASTQPTLGDTKSTLEDRLKLARAQQKLEQSDTDMCKFFSCGNKAQSGQNYCSQGCYNGAKKCTLCSKEDKKCPGLLACSSCVEKHTSQKKVPAKNKPQPDEKGYTLVGGDVPKDAAAEALATSVAEKAIEEAPNRFSALDRDDTSHISERYPTVSNAEAWEHECSTEPNGASGGGVDSDAEE
jgi:hypothetical protein